MALGIVTNNEETDPDVLIAAFFRTFPDYSADEQKRITSAWNFLCTKSSALKRGCGKPYYLHPMRVAAILAESRMDADCIISGFFHNILTLEGVTPEEISAQFGPAVAKIISDTSKITNLKINSKTIQQADSIRKMLFAITTLLYHVSISGSESSRMN